ncbi:hypothetical protein EJ03DRAFT_372382 [Teratosphaeria nubilosa]|uniref:Allantoin permease n=1 Tax=Teratosphaeria nubilosa TaxID=161662 RepID=A0A6G1LH68_9PEZI|nr:hypothetical protein EJ03DRAFT_372382 [Teratosphaeria nubilosa]
MSDTLNQRFKSAKDEIKKRSRPSEWVLPKQTTTFADPDKWSNIDADVTPIERRTWTSWTVLGFWISDAMNAQGWEAPSSIIAVGLTWREAVYCIILGSLIDTIPLILNGAIGADLHVPFPVAARSSFGFYLARFAVVVRLITALFWHAIQTYTGSTAITQCIRAIWPSYLDIPNHIPASVGITSQEMVSHFIFWSIQFPILLTPPHKLQWFFWFKSVIVIVVSVATVISMTMKAGGTGDIWDQQYSVHGSKRSWLILSSVMSVAGGWATMATNVPDFTRYINIRRGVILVTITAGWVMVPWKIVYSAESLLNFMAGLSIFLCPISAILATDYWLVKKKHIDVPSLYRRHARYRYDYGCNWRAAAAFIVSVVPNTPGLAKAVNASVEISAGIQHVYDMNYLYGFISASFVYWSLSYMFPATETMIPATIHEDVAILDGVEYKNDCVHGREMHTQSGSMSEKKAPHSETKLL